MIDGNSIVESASQTATDDKATWPRLFSEVSGPERPAHLAEPQSRVHSRLQLVKPAAHTAVLGDWNVNEPISIVEGAYQTAADDETWLRGIAQIILDSSDDYTFGMGNFIDASDPPRLKVWSGVCVPTQSLFQTIVENTWPLAGETAMRAMVENTEISTMSEIFARIGVPFDAMSKGLQQFGCA